MLGTTHCVPFEAELADRLKHPEARLSQEVWLLSDEILRHERCHSVQHIERGVIPRTP
jgi:hypothetical protein